MIPSIPRDENGNIINMFYPNYDDPFPESDEESFVKPVQPTITYIIEDKSTGKKMYTQDPVLDVLNKIDNDTIPKVEDSDTINSFITKKLDYNFDNDDEDDDEYYD